MTAYIQLTDAKVALEDTGQGPPVLLLHGFPATRHLWSHVAPLLAQAGFRVLVPDLIGYGSSEAPGNRGLDMVSQARWMLELLDVLGFARVAVVAHDVGSAAAQLMVATAPRRIRGLAVLDGVYGGEWAMDAIVSIQAWDPEEAHRLFPVLARRIAKSGALRDMLAAYEGKHGGLQLIRAARDLDPRQTEHIGEALRASGVPALVLWGEQDTFLSIDGVGRPLAELLGAALVRLPGGHFTPLDCPGEVATALRDFLTGLRTELTWGGSMKKIDVAAAPRRKGCDYPPPFDGPCRERVRHVLGDVAGLTQFGVNLQRLPPGAWSSQRHWHTAEDEFVWVLEGEVVLVTDTGEEVLIAGDCAGFKAGAADGHHIQNRSNSDALLLEIGSRRPEEDVVEYPGIDLKWSAATGDTHKDGTPY